MLKVSKKISVLPMKGLITLPKAIKNTQHSIKVQFKKLQKITTISKNMNMILQVVIIIENIRIRNMKTRIITTHQIVKVDLKN